jgi:CubicO group peptidase (beta-lactamase class C family)
MKGQRRRALLMCGILASVLYVGTDVLATLRYEGYRYTDRAVSELFAIGAPTSPLVVPLFLAHGVLQIAFALGVWMSAAGQRGLRITASLLAGIGLVDLVAYFFPMHMRGVPGTLTDAMHVGLASVTVLLCLLAIGFAARAFGPRFRLYSIGTIVALIAAGGRAGWDGARVAANLATPWLGVTERVCIYGYMSWMAVLAGVLLWVRGAAAAAPLVIDERKRSEPSAAGRHASRPVAINGFAHPRFEAVREAFAENFSRRHELGAACCIYQHGEKVVDLWGGIRNKTTGEPWEEDTMVLVFSATKGLAAMAMAVAHSRGWLDYEERVCAYWPEFAQEGKDKVTVRQLLAHQAGLFAFGEPVDRHVVADLDRLAMVLARQKPAWAPGERQAYHAITLGFFEGELLRRVDPRHRSLGQFFQDEIASPLDLDFYIRLPESIPDSRLAVLEQRHLLKALACLPFRLMLASMNPRSPIFRALMVNPGSGVSLDAKRVYARNLEVPSGGGVGTARSMARAYSAFATGGRELGLRAETLQALSAPAVPSAHGFYDEGVKGEVQFSLGFMKTCPGWPFGHEGAFGAPGAGGALGFADPQTGMAYAYVTNRMGGVTGDARDLALRNAIPSAPGPAGQWRGRDHAAA